MKKGRFAGLSTNKHAFVTRGDLETGRRLEKELECLEEQQESLTPNSLIVRFRVALSKYHSHPCQKTFDALKVARQEEVFFRRDTRIKDAAVGLQRSFYISEAAPWARQILERAIDVASKKLSSVTALESARVEKLTGQPMTQPNEIVVAAEQTVQNLSVLLQKLSRSRSGGRIVSIRPARVLAMFGFGDGPATKQEPPRFTTARTIKPGTAKKRSTKKGTTARRTRRPSSSKAPIGAGADEGIFSPARPLEESEERERIDALHEGTV